MSSIEEDKSSRKLVDEMGQFAPIPYSFIEQSEGLSFHARWLFVVLSYHRNASSGKAWPSYDRIQELTGMRREMIAKSIQQLESKGWLTKKKRFGNSNVYTLNIPPPSANREKGAAVNDVSEGVEEAIRRNDVGIRLAEL
jgi:hypothetical protein